MSVSEKVILQEASRVALPQDQVWAVLTDLGIGTGEVPAQTVRNVLYKHAQDHGWSEYAVKDVLRRLGALEETTE